MFVHNRWLEQTGTIIQENTQQLVSGLVSYESPYVIVTGTRFAVIDRKTYVRTSDETKRAIFDDLTVQFGQDQIINLNSTGITIIEGSTRLQYDGVEFRAMNVTSFGQKFNRSSPIGITEVKFRRITPLAD